jgi:hypothetical protein
MLPTPFRRRPVSRRPARHQRIVPTRYGPRRVIVNPFIPKRKLQPIRRAPMVPRNTPFLYQKRSATTSWHAVPTPETYTEESLRGKFAELFMRNKNAKAIASSVNRNKEDWMGTVEELWYDWLHDRDSDGTGAENIDAMMKRDGLSPDDLFDWFVEETLEAEDFFDNMRPEEKTEVHVIKLNRYRKDTFTDKLPMKGDITYWVDDYGGKILESDKPGPAGGVNKQKIHVVREFKSSYWPVSIVDGMMGTKEDMNEASKVARELHKRKIPFIIINHGDARTSIAVSNQFKDEVAGL